MRFSVLCCICLVYGLIGISKPACSLSKHKVEARNVKVWSNSIKGFGWRKPLNCNYLTKFLAIFSLSSAQFIQKYKILRDIPKINSISQFLKSIWSPTTDPEAPTEVQSESAIEIMCAKEAYTFINKVRSVKGLLAVMFPTILIFLIICYLSGCYPISRYLYIHSPRFFICRSGSDVSRHMGNYPSQVRGGQHVPQCLLRWGRQLPWLLLPTLVHFCWFILQFFAFSRHMIWRRIAMEGL